MGTPIHNGGEDYLPDDLLQGGDEHRLTDLQGDDLEADLEDRVMESAVPILSAQDEVNIPPPSPSEDTNDHFNERVQVETEQRSFRRIISKISKAVSRIWEKRLLARRKHSKKYCELLLDKTELTKKRQQSRSQHLQNFFSSRFRFLFSSFKHYPSCVDFCGISPESPEGLVAMAFLLRAASRWAEADSEPPVRGNDSILYDAQSIYTDLDLVMQDVLQHAPLCGARILAKLASTPYKADMSCQDIIRAFIRKDADSCKNALRMAEVLDRLLPQDLFAVLCSFRESFSSGWEDLILSWLKDPSLHPESIQIVVDANLLDMRAAHQSRREEYETLVDSLIMHIFPRQE